MEVSLFEIPCVVVVGVVVKEIVVTHTHNGGRENCSSSLVSIDDEERETL